MSDDEKKDVETQEETPTPEAPAEKEAPAAETKEEAAEEPKADADKEAPAEAEAPAEPQPEPEPEKPTDVLEEIEEEAAAETEVEEVAKDKLYRDIRPGMVVRVHEIIKDISPKGEERRRVQVFEGMVLGLNGSGVGRTMTIRKVSKGFGVEKIFPLAAPTIEKVEVVKRFRVRHSKLNYLRGVVKRGRIKKRFGRKLKEIKE